MECQPQREREGFTTEDTEGTEGERGRGFLGELGGFTAEGAEGERVLGDWEGAGEFHR